MVLNSSWTHPSSLDDLDTVALDAIELKAKVLDQLELDIAVQPIAPNLLAGVSSSEGVC